MDNDKKLQDLLFTISAPVICDLCGLLTGGSSNGPLCNCVWVVCGVCHLRYKSMSMEESRRFHDCQTKKRHLIEELMDTKYEGEQETRRSLTGYPEFDEVIYDCIDTLSSKGQEYTAGSPDRLENFKRAARKLSRANRKLEMQDIWWIFFEKHYTALETYIQNDCNVISNEGIRGRILDLITYLVLFYKMTIEIEEERKKGKTDV